MKDLARTLFKTGACLIFITILSLNNPGFSQTTSDAQLIKTDTADELASSFVRAVNSGNIDILGSFVNESFDPVVSRRYTPSEIIDMNMAFYYESAGKGFDYHGITETRSNAVVASVFNRLTGALLDLTIPVSGDESPTISGRCEMKLSATENSTAPMNIQEISERMDVCVERLLADDQFSGTIILAKNDKPFYSRLCGMASREYDVENRLDTQFNVASLGKMFTGVAVAQLVQQGKLSFDDPISKHIPEGWVSQEIAEKTTIRHLLTHTSGYGTYFRALYTQIKQPFFRGLDDYKGIISEEKPAFEPGERWSYSNTGMHLLGVIIENVSGESYYDYMNENVFGPVGMNLTDFRDKDIPLKGRATGYSKEQNEWRTVLFTRVFRGGPSGGGFSTAPDLMKFRNALLENRLLNPVYTQLALSAKPEVNSPFYGYGFFVSESKAGRVAEHGGDGAGINTQLKMYLDSGYTIIVLSNFSRPAAQIISNVASQLIEK